MSQAPMPDAAEVASAVVSLMRAAERVRNRASALLEPYDLTPQQYHVLRILRVAHPEPLPTLQIGSRMIEQCPGVTRILDRLVEKGLVRRERGHDRRQVHCSLTEEGLSVLEVAREAIQVANREVLGHFSSAELVGLRGLLERIAPPR